MLIDESDTAKTVKALASEAEAEWERLKPFQSYYCGHQDTPYKPKTATAEFGSLVNKSVTNLTRLVVRTLTQRLIVDGYKASSTDVENAAPWSWWQTNGLDARQKAVYDASATCGYSFVQVLPGEPDPVMKPISPLEWFVKFDAPDDEWGQLAIKRSSNGKGWILVDDMTIRTVEPDPTSPGLMTITDETVHGLGVVPFVVFRNEYVLVGAPVGEVEPCIPIQDRLNQTVFDLLVAETYSAAPQKYIAGLSLRPTDASGNAVIDVRAFAKAVWVDPNPDTRFGSLPEANLNNLCTAIENTLRMFGLMSQTPPHYLLGEMVNLSAEALVAADSTMAKKVGDHQIVLGEAWEQSFRLAAKAAGDLEAAEDTDAQVRWRDTEPRSMAAVVDVLGKLKQMLEVPAAALWDQVPGITEGDLELWRTEAAKVRLRQAADAANGITPPTPPTPTRQIGIQGSQPIAS